MRSKDRKAKRLGPGTVAAQQPLADLRRYGLAAISVGLALGLAVVLEHFHFRDGAIPLLLFACAISSWYGGRGPAVLAYILSTVGFYWYFIEPVRTIYIHPFEIPYFIIFAAFGSLITWFSAVRQRAEAALREQAHLVNLTHDTVFVMDMEGVIKFWNLGAEERYGWTAEQAVGRVVHDLLKTVFPAPLEEITAKLTRTGRWEGELVHTKKDGSRLVAASRWSLERGRRGEPAAILETNNDITERKRAEEALRRLNRELQAISNCNQVLLRATEEQSLLESICRIVCEEASYCLAWVGFAQHDEAKSVLPVAWTGAEEGYLASAGIIWADRDRGRGPTGTAIRSGKSCCIQDFATDPRLAPWREDLLQRGFRSGIALPLKDEHNNTFGSLTIHSAQPNAFTPEEIRLLEELAADLAFGIVTLRSRAARQRAEEEVSLLSFALDNVRETALLIDDTARFHYVNNEGCRLLGYTRAELLGMSVPDIDLEFPAGRWSDHWRDLKAQRSLNFESRHRTRDGRIFPVEVGANYFEYGGRAYNLALVRDITERKHAEEALRESEANLKRAQEVAHIGSWHLDITRNRLTWSDEVFRIFGVPLGTALSYEAFLDLVHPGDRASVHDAWSAALHGAPYDIEHRIVVSGDLKWVRERAQLEFSKEGNATSGIGTVQDITELKRAEAALRSSEAYLAEAQRLSHTGSWAFDLAGNRYFYVSEECSRIFEMDAQEGPWNREVISRLIHPEDWDKVREDFEKSIREKVDASSEFRVVLPSGTAKYVQAIRHPVLNDAGDVAKLVGTVIEITERKRAEEQRERLRQLEADLAHINRVSVLGELIASIAHEVNQPLSGVVSNGSACLRWLDRDAPDVEEAREAARRIVRDGKRAGEVIARIRALTRRDATPTEKLDLNETIGEVLALIGDEAKRNSVVIRTQFADDLSPVCGDRVQLQQVVLNLVVNAIEAMSRVGERSRELVITTQNIDADQVQVMVEDSGPGLDPQAVDKIFDPFFTTKPGGMGMGLSISRSILEAHGGRLWAAAKDAPGTVFHFTLPKYREEGRDERVTRV